MSSLRVIVPFKLNNAKSRLSPLFSLEERRRLALTMLDDVVKSASRLGEVVICTRDPLPRESIIFSLPSKVVECDLELDSALNEMVEYWQKKGWPTDFLIIMADLPLVRPQDLQELIQTPGDVVIVPGRGGGTNLILIRDPRFRVHYYGLSFLKHLQTARDMGLHVGVYESYRCGCDIDEPSDLVEVLIHGQGQTPKLLKELGLSLNGHKEKVRPNCLRDKR